MQTLHDINKFSFTQLFNNENGKTSASAWGAWISVTVGCLGFIAGVVDKMFISHSTEIMNMSVTLTGIGAALLGARKVITTKNPDPNALVPDPEPEPEEEPNENKE